MNIHHMLSAVMRDEFCILRIPEELKMTFAVILLFWGLFGCEAFNIDTSVPIIKLGLPESYFGYSVSPHYVRTDRTNVRPV